MIEFSLLITGSLLILQNTKPDFINCGKIMEYLGLKPKECSVSKLILKKRMYRASLRQRSCYGNARSLAALKKPVATMGFKQPRPESKELSGQRTAVLRETKSPQRAHVETSLFPDAHQAAVRRVRFAPWKGSAWHFRKWGWTLNRSMRKLTLSEPLRPNIV